MIRIVTQETNEPLTGKSKWWGEPDMPEELDWPAVSVTDEEGETYDDPLTFICQLRCEDIAPLDPDGMLPHEGMLYFFAALDYFLGDLDTPAYPGMGEWEKRCFRVSYAAHCDDLHTHHLNYPDGTPATKPAEALRFERCSPHNDDLRLLGYPYLEEVREAMPDKLSLLQVDECDRWGLTFHDSGMLNFLISPDDLRQRRWDETTCYLYSF
jgi:uncharacterized protein YwqG